MTARTALMGKRILLVESDAFLAAYVGGSLAAAGAEVVGPFSSTQDARSGLDGAHAIVRTIEGDNEDLTLPTLWTSRHAATDRTQPSCFYRPFGAFQIVEAVERLLLDA